MSRPKGEGLSPDVLGTQHGKIKPKKGLKKGVTQPEVVSVEQKEIPEWEVRLANIKAEVITNVREAVDAKGLTAEEIMERLLVDKTADSKTKLSYTERDALIEGLLQIADVHRFIGESIDKDVEETLNNIYKKLTYSKLFQEEMAKQLLGQDEILIGHVLADEKFDSHYQLISLLKTDEQREKVFVYCKGRLDIASTLINVIKDTDVALRMLSEISETTKHDLKKREIQLKWTAAKIANELFATGKLDVLIDAVKTDVFHLSELKDVINQLQEQPEILIDLAKEGQNLSGIKYLLKFISDPNILQSLIDQGPEVFKKLESVQAESAVAFTKAVKEALEKEPVLTVLTRLNPDKPNEYNPKNMDACNKFVVRINERNEYCIDWANMNSFEYHRDLFKYSSDYVDRLEKCGGGYISFQEDEDRVLIKFCKSSSDFGFYSSKVLKRFNDQILHAMKREYPDKQVELTIVQSTEF